MTHGAMVNLLSWHRATLRGGEQTLQFASPTFDVSIHEMFSSLQSGGTLHVVDDEARHDVSALTARLQQRQIRKAILPVVVLQHLAELWREGGSAWPLAEVTATGEQLRVTGPVREMFARTNCELHNHYGPTETHVVTTYEMPRDAAGWASEPQSAGPSGIRGSTFSTATSPRSRSASPASCTFPVRCSRAAMWPGML